MSDNGSSGGGCGCSGCGGLIITILILWAVFFGLPTPWGTFNVDLIPPQIREVPE